MFPLPYRRRVPLAPVGLFSITVHYDSGTTDPQKLANHALHDRADSLQIGGIDAVTCREFDHTKMGSVNKHEVIHEKNARDSSNAADPRIDGAVMTLEMLNKSLMKLDSVALLLRSHTCPEVRDAALALVKTLDDCTKSSTRNDPVWKHSTHSISLPFG